MIGRPVRGIGYRLIRAIAAGMLLWAAAQVCFHAGVDRVIAALALLLGVLAFATSRDRLLAFVTPAAATLGMNYYFIEETTSLRIATMDGVAMFVAVLVTSFTASELSIRAQRRADEAERRREEMERLQQFSARLLSAHTVAETSQIAARGLVELFSASQATVRVGNIECVYPPGGAGPLQHGAETPRQHIQVSLHTGEQQASIDVVAPPPSAEVSRAIGNVVGLVIDRARGFEERTRIEAVRRGDELRATIFNAVAHDFRTPLTSIKAAASALRSSSASIFEPDRELIAVINEEADRLEALIRESLALARLESLGETPTEPCSVRALVAKVTDRLSRYLDRRRVEIDIPEDLPPVRGDRFLLELMLLQVIDNAWKYSKSGARIVIDARLDAENVALSVWNEGLRIPDYEKERIFDKFYRGLSDRYRTEGSGLGLAIAKSIVEAHRGSVWLENGSDGARFRFLLPLGLASNEDASEPHNPADR